MVGRGETTTRRTRTQNEIKNMADSRQEITRQREAQEQQAAAAAASDKESQVLLQKQISSLRKVSDKLDAAAQQAKEDQNINLELVDIAKADGDEEAARHFTLAAMADNVKASVLVQESVLEDGKATRLENVRNASIARGDALEAQREEKARFESLSRADQLKETDKGVGGPIKTPSFLTKLAKLALGVVGVKVFEVMIKNFDSIKAFVKEKIIPATEGIFTFFKDTVFPFISNNFKAIIDGFIALSAAILVGFVFVKIINAIKIIRTGLIALQLGMIATGNGLMSMTTGILSKLGTAVKLLRAGFLAVTAFTMTTLVPALMTSVAAMSIAIAPFLPIIIGVGLAIAGIVFLLHKLKESLGFDSVFDVMMLGVMHLKDAFGHIVNAIGKVVNFIMGIVEKVAKFIGFDIVLPKMDTMSTDNASGFKKEVLQKQEKAKAEKLSKGDATSDIPELPESLKSGIPEKSAAEVKAIKKDKPDNMRLVTKQENLTHNPLGMRETRKLPALEESRQQVLKAESSASSGTFAINTGGNTTNNTSSSSAVAVVDASPATDDLDRVAA